MPRGAGLGRRRRRRRRGACDVAERDRLSGADQGGGRRRRQGHEGGAQRRPSWPRRLQLARGRSQGRLRQRRGLYREISRTAAPYRNPGPGRQPWQCRASGRARLLAAAPPPEGAGGSALARPSTPSSASAIGELVADGDAQARLSRRRHDRVPLRGRRVLFHRDEHAPAGRASGHRDDHRHRSGARADPHRRRRAAGLQPEGYRLRRPCHRMPHQCRESARPSCPRPA